MGRVIRAANSPPGMMTSSAPPSASSAALRRSARLIRSMGPRSMPMRTLAPVAVGPSATGCRLSGDSCGSMAARAAMSGARPGRVAPAHSGRASGQRTLTMLVDIEVRMRSRATSSSDRPTTATTSRPPQRPRRHRWSEADSPWGTASRTNLGVGPEGVR